MSPAPRPPTISGSDRPGRTGAAPSALPDPGETVLARLGLRFTAWAEKWFPDAYVFAALAVVVVAVAAMVNMTMA